MDPDSPISTRYDRFVDFYRTHRETVAQALAVAVDDTDLAGRATDEAMIETAARWRGLRHDREQAAVVFRRALDRAIAGPAPSNGARRGQATTDHLDSGEARTRALVVLRFLHGWPADELSTATGLSPASVRQRLDRLGEDDDRSTTRVHRALSSATAAHRSHGPAAEAIETEGRRRRHRRILMRTATTIGVIGALTAIVLLLTADLARVTGPNTIRAEPQPSSDQLVARVPTGDVVSWASVTRRGLTLISDRSDRSALGSLARMFGRADDLRVLTSEDGILWEERMIRDGVLRDVEIADIAGAAGVITLLGVDTSTDSGAEVVLRSSNLDRWDRIDLVVPREGSPLPAGLVWAHDTSLVGAGEEVAVRVDAFAVRDFGDRDLGDRDLHEGLTVADAAVGEAPVRRYYTYDDGEWVELARSGIEDWNAVVDLWRADGTWWAVSVDPNGATVHRLAGDTFERVGRLDGVAAAWNDGRLVTYVDGSVSLSDPAQPATTTWEAPLGPRPLVTEAGGTTFLTDGTIIGAVSGEAFRVHDLGAVIPSQIEGLHLVPEAALGHVMLVRPSDSGAQWWSVADPTA